MNNSNAAAKRRRAGIQPTIPPMPPSQGSTPNQGQGQGQGGGAPPQGGFTLPQVIALIDTRLITLEKFMKETKESTADLTIPALDGGDGADSGADTGAVFMDSKEFTEFVDDINQRFQLFADEINGLKEIVLKLQGFTMDVNKMLLATMAKSGEPIPNISFDVADEASSSGDEGVAKMELAEQTFVLESQAAAPEAEPTPTTSGKNKKR